MDTVTLAHAKEHLEELMERAARGEDVRIADQRLGTMKLQPLSSTDPGEPPYPKRVLGLMKHLADIPDDRLFAPLTEDELAWLSGESSEVER